MSDNVIIEEAVSGSAIAADEVTRNGDSEKQQIVKIALGAEGEFDTLVDSGQKARANSIPVALSSEDAAYLDGVEGLLTTIDADTSDLASAVKAEDAAHSSGDKGVMALAVRNENFTTLTNAEGDYSGIMVDRYGRLQTLAELSLPASGGATPYKLISAASTNATSLKASAGQIYMITATNTNAAVRYLKLYNKASSPTVGTDTPVLVFAIPGGTAGAGTNIPVPAGGLVFGTGIAFAITTGAADSDTGAVAANEIIINIGYK